MTGGGIGRKLWVSKDLKFPGVPKDRCGPRGRQNKQEYGHLGSCSIGPPGTKGIQQQEAGCD